MSHHTPATTSAEISGTPLRVHVSRTDGDSAPSSAHDADGTHVADELLGHLAPDAQGGLGRLGPYRLLQVLGHGGMGIVFLADDTTLQRRVALKAMRPALAQKPVARERFLREARATSQLEHEHIVTTYQVGEDRGIPYMAMQLLRGGSLATWLGQGNQPTLRQAVRIVREAALGLAAAHARGLIHRDVKPSNLWLEDRAADAPTGRATTPVRVKLLDFGLARVVNDPAALTRVGAIVGTPTYMSPEQARGRDIDPRSDLFSLGCVLYRLCTGTLPFRGEDTPAILNMLIHCAPRPAQAVNPEVPASLANLIDRLLAKEPAARPASAQAVAEELHALDRELAASDAAPKRAWSPRLRWLAGSALAGTLALVLAVVTLMPSSGTVVVRAADDAARGAWKTAVVRAVDQATGEAQAMKLGVQTLRPGRYTIDPASVPDGVRVEPVSFEVAARGAVAVTVRVDGGGGR